MPVGDMVSLIMFRYLRVNILDLFCQPTPRLIRKGEKSDTFTGLAGNPNEGRT